MSIGEILMLHGADGVDCKNNRGRGSRLMTIYMMKIQVCDWTMTLTIETQMLGKRRRGSEDEEDLDDA
jgi:hypothetical protein